MLRCENVTRERGAGRCGAEEGDDWTAAATAATTYTPGQGQGWREIVAGFELKKED
jgi:hypothetical protein